MKHSVYAGLVCGVVLIAGCSSKPASTVAVAPTQAPTPAYAMPAPIVMRPAAPVPVQPTFAAQSAAEKTLVPAATVPPDASQGDFAQQKAQTVAAISSYQQNRQQKIQAGQDPGPDMFPTYHVDAAGNLYHLSGGIWKLMTDAEIKNPTAAEYGEAQDNLQRAKEGQAAER